MVSDIKNYLKPREFWTVCICFLLFTSKQAQSEHFPYVSPGFSICWNNSGLKSASIKLSVGIFSESFNEIDGYFCNITLGKRFLLNDYSRDYIFTECEGGIFSGYLMYGTGLGTAFSRKDGKIQVSPKGTLFLGNLLFLRSDIIIKDKKSDLDVGGMVVLPLNMKYFDNLHSLYQF